MKTYAVWDTDLRVICTQEVTDEYEVFEDEDMLEITEPLNGHHYFNGQGVVPGVDYDITTIPLPCNIEIGENRYRCEDTPEFEFDAPGIYFISVIPDNPQYPIKSFQYENIV